jgi:hypothetical protein
MISISAVSVQHAYERWLSQKVETTGNYSPPDCYLGVIIPLVAVAMAVVCFAFPSADHTASGKSFRL